MFNFKKVSAIAASVLLTGMTMGIAAAANYPAPFVVGSTANVAIVYGTGEGMSSLDVVEAGNVQSDLSARLGTTGGNDSSVTGGDSIELWKSSTKWNLGDSLVANVLSADVTDDGPNGGLPSLLADGKYLDDDNDEFDYTQKIELNNLQLVMFADSDYVVNGVDQGDNPTLGIKITSSGNVLNYTLDFVDEPLWSDLTSTDLEILGKNYFILSYTNATTLNLLDSAKSTILSEGETTAVEVGGTSYDVSINFIGTAAVKLDINGEITNSLAAGETQKLSTGAYVGIKEINVQDYAGGTKNVEFSIGTGKLKLVTNQDVEMNDETISDMTAIINHTGTSTGDKLSAIQIKWAVDDDSFITPEQELLMPGFGAVKLSMAGMKYPKTESIYIEPGGDTYITLKSFPLKDGTVNIDLVYSNAAGTFYTGIGKDATHRLATSNTTELLFNGSEYHDTFIVSYTDGTTAESYYAKAKSFAEKSAGTTSAYNVTTIQYYKDGAWIDKKAEAKDADTLQFGNAEITINKINKNNKWVNMTASAGTNFNMLYSKEGLTIALPYANKTTNVETLSTIGVMNTTAATYTLVFGEEDKNGNVNGTYYNFNVTLGFDSSSTPKVEVDDVVGEGVTFDEIESTDVERSFMYSELGTEFLHTKRSGSPNKLEVIYHGGESYGEIYLTAPEATVTAGGGGGASQLGDVLVKDTEISSVATKNLIIVGGSCINSAAATVVGGAHCSEKWTDATGVGTGQFLIKGYANATIGGDLVLLVAGYEAADTVNAATYLRNQIVDTSKEYKGTSATSATLVTETA